MMKKIQLILMTLFCLPLLLAGILFLLGDVLNMDLACRSAASDQERFIVSTLLILLTLALVPLSLKLFKFQYVAKQIIETKTDGLRRWGVVRLMVLGTLLVVNTLLYYVYGFESSFGYLTIVVLLTMPFVFPSMKRCIAETESALELEVVPETEDTDAAAEDVVSDTETAEEQ